MKKVILLFIVLMSVKNFGQSLIVHAGVGYNEMEEEITSLYNVSYDYKGITSYLGGISYQHTMFGNFFLETGINYCKKGFFKTQKYVWNALEYRNQYRFHFLQIPLRVGYNFKNSTKIIPFLSVGAIFSYILMNEAGDLDYKITDFFAFNPEGGFYFKGFMLKVGYDLGIMNLNKDDKSSFSRNKTLYTAIGYKFDLKK